MAFAGWTQSFQPPGRGLVTRGFMVGGDMQPHPSGAARHGDQDSTAHIGAPSGLWEPRCLWGQALDWVLGF